MKNKILSLILAICLIIPCLFLFTSCKVKINTFTLYFDLNNSEASYTDEFMEEHNFSKNYAKLLNSYYYGGIEHSLLGADVMVAPEGKVFAGWYFDKATSAGNEISEYNFNHFFNDGTKKSSVTLYARWVDEGTKIIIFDLNNKNGGANADFKLAYKNRVTFMNRTPEYIVTDETDLENLFNSFPKESDLVLPEEYYFDNWYLNSDELTMEILESIKNGNSVTTKIYAKWNTRPVLSLHYLLNEDGHFINDTTRGIIFNDSALDDYNSLKFTYTSEYEISTKIYLDEITDKYNQLNLQKTLMKKFDASTQEVDDEYAEKFQSAVLEKWVVILYSNEINEETGNYDRIEMDFTLENIPAIVENIQESDLYKMAVSGGYAHSISLYPVFNITQ